MKKILLAILISISACVGSVAHASILSVQSSLPTVKTGEFFTVTALLNAESKSINTLEGDVVYDNNNLEVEKVLIGNSFVSFWIEKPRVTDNGFIHFAGIVPGGVSVDNGEIFSIVFRTRSIGNELISIKNAHLFLNDSQGTEDKVTVSNATISVLRDAPSVEDPIILDKTAPEPFNIERISDPNLYNGSYVIIFNTQDKGTGVDHYTVCELSVDCVRAESPYVLLKQNPFYYIVVTAYDVDGNTTTSTVASPWLYVGGVLIITIICVFIFFRKKFVYSHK